MRTRFAPTPSGYLHRGNAVHALLCSWWARELGAELALRVDDLDTARSRPEYRADIDEVLDWLGIACEPRFTSQLPRMPEYVAARDALIRGGDTFACSCSRSFLASGGACTCRERGIPLLPHESALRWRCSQGEIVIWRRDDLPAYHLASVVDDHLLQVTHILRGADLAEATTLQRELATTLGLGGISTARVLHHALVLDADGVKLSKTRSATGAGPLPRTAQVRDAVTADAVRIAAEVGISPSSSC